MLEDGRRGRGTQTRRAGGERGGEVDGVGCEDFLSLHYGGVNDWCACVAKNASKN